MKTLLCIPAIVLGALSVSASFGEEPEGFVRIDGELVDKRLVVRVLDMENRRYGDPEFYDPDHLDETDPLKYRMRIYARWHQEEKRWLPDFVEKNGYFCTPDRFILPGSVVPGEWLGYPKIDGSSEDLNFEFLKNKPDFAAWRPTYKPIHMVWSVLRSRNADGSPIRETRVISRK